MELPGLANPKRNVLRGIASLTERPSKNKAERSEANALPPSTAVPIERLTPWPLKRSYSNDALKRGLLVHLKKEKRIEPIPHTTITGPTIFMSPPYFLCQFSEDSGSPAFSGKIL
jgi:hypothetical protein